MPLNPGVLATDVINPGNQGFPDSHLHEVPSLAGRALVLRMRYELQTTNILALNSAVERHDTHVCLRRHLYVVAWKRACKYQNRY